MVRLLTPNRSARADVEVQRRLTDSPRGTLTKAAIVGALVKVRLGETQWQWSAGVTPAVPRSSERPAASRDHCEMGRPSGRLTARPSSSVRI
jgi:hypothetical protein